MADTFTTNLNLQKPDPGPAGAFVDVSVLNANADKIDAAVKAPFVSLSRAVSAQVIANNTPTDILWDTEIEDVSGFHVAASGNLIVPAGLGGIYLVTMCMAYLANATGSRSVIAVINGTNFVSDEVLGNATVDSELRLNFMARLAAADTLRFSTSQSSGGNLSVTSLPAPGIKTRVQMVRVALA